MALWGNQEETESRPRKAGCSRTGFARVSGRSVRYWSTSDRATIARPSRRRGGHTRKTGGSRRRYAPSSMRKRNTADHRCTEAQARQRDSSEVDPQDRQGAWRVALEASLWAAATRKGHQERCGDANARWAIDMAHLFTNRDGRYHLVAAIDCQDRHLVGWRFSRSGKAGIPAGTLEDALIRELVVP